MGQSRKICKTAYSTLEIGYVILGDLHASAPSTSVPRPCWETTFHCATLVCLAYRMQKHAQNVPPVTFPIHVYLEKCSKRTREQGLIVTSCQFLDTQVSFLAQYEKEFWICVRS